MKSLRIESVKDAIREGHVWPGGYQLNVVMSDGNLLCTVCAKENFRGIVDSTKNGLRDGWASAGAEVFWEGGPDSCCHCGKEILSEYGNPMEEA
jgi:hypothetical protein